MPRSEKPIGTSGPIAVVAAGLRELRHWAGTPSYRELAKQAGYSAAVLSQAAAGQRLPTWGVVEAYVTACGGDPTQWRQRWQDAERATSPQTGVVVDESELDARLGRTLSPQERRVLQRMAVGRKNQEIAAELGLTEKTVKNYVTAVLHKLGLNNRTETASYATGQTIPPADIPKRSFIAGQAATRSQGASGDLRFKILGPIEVTIEGELVRIPPGRPRIILGALLLEPNRVVSSDRLVDVLWDYRPPETARGQIQSCISSLRRALARRDAEQPIVTEPPGYLLRVADGQLDSQVFARLVAEATKAQQYNQLEVAVGLMRQALALWREPALKNWMSSMTGGAVARLEEERLATWEMRVDLELRLGRHHAVIGELSELVGEYPLRERLRGQLMLALYRSGRTADALEWYRAGRQTLIDELGLEPSEELRRLESAILNQDPSLRWEPSPYRR